MVPAAPRKTLREADSGQVLILIGFIVALTMVTVTILLAEVITISNVASVESTDILKSDLLHAVRLAKDQVDFARLAYNGTSDQGTFQRLMNNTTRALQASFAGKGIAVDVNWSGAQYLTGLIGAADDGKIAYCGRANASPYTLRTWLTDHGFNHTDYSNGSDCADRGTNQSPTSVGKLFLELCAVGTDPMNCSTGSSLNKTVAIFEQDNLSAKSEFDSTGSGKDWGCTLSGVYVLNESQCKTLQNWTNLGGKFIKTGAMTGASTNSTLIDVLTHVARLGVNCPVLGCSWNGYSPGGTPVDVLRQGLTLKNGIVAPFPLLPGSTQGTLSNLTKNVAIGDSVRFAAEGYLFGPFASPPEGRMSAAICREDGVTYPGTGAICGPASAHALAGNWTYGSGQVYYLPTLQGEVRNRAGAELINDPDNLRPVLNLTTPGGDCKVRVTVEDWRTKYDATLYC